MSVYIHIMEACRIISRQTSSSLGRCNVQEMRLASSAKENQQKEACVSDVFIRVRDFYVEKNKNNCSMQLCGSRYFPSGFCRLSSVKQSQGCRDNRMFDELWQIICITVLGSDSPLYMTDGKQRVSKMLLMPHDLSDVWLITGQKYPPSTFLITHDLCSLKLNREIKTIS